MSTAEAEQLSQRRRLQAARPQPAEHGVEHGDDPRSPPRPLVEDEDVAGTGTAGGERTQQAPLRQMGVEGGTRSRGRSGTPVRTAPPADRPG